MIPKRALVLAEVSQLSPEDLEKVRQEALKLEKTAYEVNAVYRQTSPTVLTTEPSAEPTEPESPRPTQKKPTIKIANAPIGGGGGQRPRLRKGELAGYDADPGRHHNQARIDPPGTERHLRAGPGQLPGVAEAPVCAGQEWKGGDALDCSVGAKQVAGAAGARV